MDFYKKIVKPKDPNSVLSEKEYKCASLQAVINGAIKENNKKHLKELVGEVNEHLADLRAIKGDIRNQDKCNKIIKQLEDCLIKIANQNDVFHDVMTTIQSQLQQLQNLTNQAIKDNNLVELRRLAERMEGNINIVKEIPEVKGAINGDQGDAKVLEVVNKYTSLLNKVLEHINRQSRVVSAPMPIEEEGPNKSEAQPPPFKQNKVALNEVEEKLKLMRQKRLNRLSTFVDQQSKLSEERIKENANNEAKISEKIVENETNEPKVETGAARSSFGVKDAEKVQKPEEKNSGPSEVKSGFVWGLRNSFGKGGVGKFVPGISGRPKEPAPPPPQSTFKNTPEKPIRLISEEVQTTNSNPKEFSRNSTVTKSFAERQIEHAKNQIDHASTTKLTPPRTPTNIRKKFFDSINCVLGGATSKSIEDLPDEFKSPFEKELKHVQLKNVKKWENNSLRVEDGAGKVRRSSSDRSQEKSEDCIKSVSKFEPPPPLLPLRKNKVPLEKPVIQAPKVNLVEKSASHSHLLNKPRTTNKGELSAEEAIRKKVWRTSLDFDTLMIKRAEPLDECTIEIKRDSSSSSSTMEPPPEERCSFSSFKASTDNYSVENPLYAHLEDLRPRPSIKRKDSVHLDNLLLAAKTSSTAMDMIHEENYNRKLRRMSSQSIPNKFLAIEPVISKLEQAIQYFRGLKRDDDYFWLDKLLSKYYVKVDEVPTRTAFDQIEKESLLERLKKANKDLDVRVNSNEGMLKRVFEEQVEMLGMKYRMR